MQAHARGAWRLLMDTGLDPLATNESLTAFSKQTALGHALQLRRTQGFNTWVTHIPTPGIAGFKVFRSQKNHLVVKGRCNSF
jgi:hypothetical protein